MFIVGVGNTSDHVTTRNRRHDHHDIDDDYYSAYDHDDNCTDHDDDNPS